MTGINGRRSFSKSYLIRKILSYIIAAVWGINGLIKIFNIVPRHQQIVAEILGSSSFGILTKAIGLGEMLLAIWILTSIKSRLCAWFQVIIVMLMNTLEFFLAPDLLLFGKLNIVLATIFCLVILYQEYGFRTKSMEALS